MNFILKLGNFTKNKHNRLIDKLSLFFISFIKRGTVHHLIGWFLSLFNQNLVKLRLNWFFTDFTARRTYLGWFIILFVDGDPIKLSAKFQMILDQLVIQNFLNHQTDNLFEFALVRRIHITSNMLFILIQWPFKTSILFPSFIHHKCH